MRGKKKGVLEGTPFLKTMKNLNEIYQILENFNKNYQHLDNIIRNVWIGF